MHHEPDESPPDASAPARRPRPFRECTDTWWKTGVDAGSPPDTTEAATAVLRELTSTPAESSPVDDQ